ncbi:MAG: ADP-ribosylglycohydrolase family protein [Desulfovibrionaceae bacterium]|nr:ADP-ribosylglycohydrolase family protein [Desulfovibrionaceae bacterium]MBF0514457.1 ADP-ribosylglycohydrolase family protein [Desulfovibrionaceae bacterium]
MNEKAMALASFAGDSLALGAHWIYDAKVLAETFGRVEELRKPLPNSYHPTKDAGEFTHYGDQTYVLLESLAAKKAFDLDDFAARWRALFDGYAGYLDNATKNTLSQFAAGWGPAESGSRSTDLAGAARIAPLVYLYRNDLDSLLRSASLQTQMTHNTPQVVEAARFLARAATALLDGADIREAFSLAKASAGDAQLASLVDLGLAAAGKDTVSTVAAFGQSCHLDHAFPSVIQIAASYENDLKGALVASVMAGGDSAARNLALGMLLGARLGMRAVPETWLAALKRRADIETLLAGLD